MMPQSVSQPTDPSKRLEALYAESLIASFVPPSLHLGLVAYLAHHIAPGSFLRAVLENDLIEAVRRADPESQAGLHALVRWLLEEAPVRAWTSPEDVQQWIQLRAVNGRAS